MKLKKILCFIILLPIFVLISCSNNNNTKSVVTSFYTVNEFTKELVKDTSINVTCLIEGAIEPHDFEPSSKQIALMHDSNLIILNGNDLEEFASSLNSSSNLNGKILNASMNNESISINDTLDPHTFVSVHQALTMLTTIKDRLVLEFVEDSNKILENYSNYYAELEELDNEFIESLNNFNKPLIVGHEAFNYFKNDYNLNIKSVLGLHEEEPTPAKIKEIEDYINQNNIKTIYAEYFEENEAIEMIASDTNVNIKYLYTCEMMDSNSLSYIECQRHNLETLIK